VGNGSLKVGDADKGYTGGPKEMERIIGCVKSQAYQGATSANYE